MRKLPAKYNVVAVPFLLSIVMSGVISLIATVRALGLVDGLLGLWLHAWAFSWCIAFPTVLVVLPTVRRIVGVFVEKPGH
ncbi:MAG: DUF2798 domain-containing protein [Alphaproteobacteria bacterium]|nr:MAG: DUF2798 domain-containing protein [Alphaproteobacteria bacterium]